MDFDNFKEFIPNVEKEFSFTVRSGLVDKNGHFYHVTQQMFNRTFSISSEAATYRDHLMKNLCSDFKVLPICNIIMPTHVHDVFMTEDFNNMRNLLHVININFSKFIRNENRLRNRPNQNKIFADSPSYERICTIDHLFYIFKYLYDNPDTLKEKNKFVPYSCFNSWEKSYFKPYNEKFYKKIFGINLNEIVSLCKSKTKQEFKAFSVEKFGDKEII